jgi:hypothetical protein
LSALSAIIGGMYESAGELAAMQRLLDDSFARASEHLRSIMAEPRRLTAERLVAEVPSPAVLNLATVTASGEPRISAVDGHLVHGHWYFTTAGPSPKARQLAARPATSASFTPRDGFGVFCHGRASFLAPGDERRSLVEHCTAVYGMSPEGFGEGVVYVRIDADWLVGFAMTDEEMAAIEVERKARTG